MTQLFLFDMGTLPKKNLADCPHHEPGPDELVEYGGFSMLPGHLARLKQIQQWRLRFDPWMRFPITFGPDGEIQKGYERGRSNHPVFQDEEPPKPKRRRLHPDQRLLTLDDD